MKVTDKKKIEDWLNQLKQDVLVVAPVDTQGKLVYKEIEDISQIVWDFERTDMPPRSQIFPMTESILSIEQGATTILKDPPAPREKVLFAVRPCDASSMVALDALFIDTGPIDPQYARNRRSVSLIGLSCPKMWDSCFCTVVGGAPDNTEGLDILLTKFDDFYSVKIVTKRGEELAANLSMQEMDMEIPSPILNDKLPTLSNTKEWMEQFNDIFWNQLSHSCLSCRACSFVCPTCRCYDVRDELTSIKPGIKTFERLRAWDSCTAVGYRRIAGGHNPRDTQTKRLKNRFYCKFMYFPVDFNAMGCVGCGRCIDACPVGINILEVISKVEDLTVKVKMVA